MQSYTIPILFINIYNIMHAEAGNITCRSTVEKLHIGGSCA